MPVVGLEFCLFELDKDKAQAADVQDVIRSMYFIHRIPSPFLLHPCGQRLQALQLTNLIHFSTYPPQYHPGICAFYLRDPTCSSRRVARSSDCFATHSDSFSRYPFFTIDSAFHPHLDLGWSTLSAMREFHDPRPTYKAGFGASSRLHTPWQLLFV